MFEGSQSMACLWRAGRTRRKLRGNATGTTCASSRREEHRERRYCVCSARSVPRRRSPTSWLRCSTAAWTTGRMSTYSPRIKFSTLSYIYDSPHSSWLSKAFEGFCFFARNMLDIIWNKGLDGREGTISIISLRELKVDHRRDLGQSSV